MILHIIIVHACTIYIHIIIFFHGDFDLGCLERSRVEIQLLVNCSTTLFNRIII